MADKKAMAMIFGLPKHPDEDDPPDGEEESEGEEESCKELWDAIQSKDYDAFHEALNAWLDVKRPMSAGKKPSDGKDY